MVLRKERRGSVGIGTSKKGLEGFEGGGEKTAEEGAVMGFGVSRERSRTIRCHGFGEKRYLGSRAEARQDSDSSTVQSHRGTRLRSRSGCEGVQSEVRRLWGRAAGRTEGRKKQRAAGRASTEGEA